MRDVGAAREVSVYAVSLHAPTATVDDPDLAKATLASRLEVGVDDLAHVPWREEVQVDRLLDRDHHGGVRVEFLEVVVAHGLLLSSLPPGFWLQPDASSAVTHDMSIRRVQLGMLVLAFLAFAGTARAGEREMTVTATAYNSLPGQTEGDPAIAAWGDRLEPGMKAIAVSRDLLGEGLTHGVEVRIDGLPGTYRVLDKLHWRWERRIDVYMGVDVGAARSWGKRKVRIRWHPAR